MCVCVCMCARLCVWYVYVCLSRCVCVWVCIVCVSRWPLSASMRVLCVPVCVCVCVRLCVCVCVCAYHPPHFSDQIREIERLIAALPVPKSINATRVWELVESERVNATRGRTSRNKPKWDEKKYAPVCVCVCVCACVRVCVFGLCVLARCAVMCTVGCVRMVCVCVRSRNV